MCSFSGCGGRLTWCYNTVIYTLCLTCSIFQVVGGVYRGVITQLSIRYVSHVVFQAVGGV